MGFEYSFVAVVDYLDIVGIVPDMQRHFNSVNAASEALDCICHLSIYSTLICQSCHILHLLFPIDLAGSFCNVLGIFFEPCYPAHGRFLLGCPKVLLCRASLFPNFASSHWCNFLEVNIALSSKDYYFLAYGHFPRLY